MKDAKIAEVLQEMLPYLDNSQMEQLQRVLQHTFWNCSVEEKQDGEPSEQTPDMVDLFLASKRVEGCSEKTLTYYKAIAAAQKEGEKLGLTADELAFYDALTKPQAIKDFYENEELIAITKELAETLRKNRTIDWQKRDSARAKMRMMIKKLLKKHKYPPEGMDDAVQTVMTQCELWTDNADFS